MAGSRTGGAPALPPAVVTCTAALSLVLLEYVGRRRGFYAFADGWGLDLGAYGALASFAWWGAWAWVGYVALPAAVARAWGVPLAELGLTARGLVAHRRTYAALLALALPLVVCGSLGDGFRATYPFYRLAHRSAFDFLAWEAIYLSSFVALEFFFRGFLVLGLRPALGSHAVFVSVLPYCMVHFGKPWPETVLAIAAGIVLGTVSARTGSIAGGVAVHVVVALSMDVLTLRALP